MADGLTPVIDSEIGLEDFAHMPPIHTAEPDGTVAAVTGTQHEGRLKEAGKLVPAHLT